MNDTQETILERLARIEGLLMQLRDQGVIREWYPTDEFAGLVGKAEFTVREWCRLGRIRAEKKVSGRGKHAAWVISHDELLRYRREGLLRGSAVRSEGAAGQRLHPNT